MSKRTAWLSDGDLIEFVDFIDLEDFADLNYFNYFPDFSLKFSCYGHNLFIRLFSEDFFSLILV